MMVTRITERDESENSLINVFISIHYIFYLHVNIGKYRHFYFNIHDMLSFDKLICTVPHLLEKAKKLLASPKVIY